MTDETAFPLWRRWDGTYADLRRLQVFEQAHISIHVRAGQRWMLAQIPMGIVGIDGMSKLVKRVFAWHEQQEIWERAAPLKDPTPVAGPVPDVLGWTSEDSLGAVLIQEFFMTRFPPEPPPPPKDRIAMLEIEPLPLVAEDDVVHFLFATQPSPAALTPDGVSHATALKMALNDIHTLMLDKQAKYPQLKEEMHTIIFLLRLSLINAAAPLDVPFADWLADHDRVLACINAMGGPSPVPSKQTGAMALYMDDQEQFKDMPF